ncbi:MAG: phosphotransferase, partial [Paracoccaceae bacterium]|nr:phosphotransferase [Paracoccaceae bacterium]
RANGDPYLTILKQQPETVHAERIANWLAQYNAPTFEWRKAGPSHWIKQAQKSSARQPHDFLRSKEIQILDQMAVLATQFDPQNWRVAISHGDYHPNNLLWDGNVLTGIDIGGSAYLPIYKDIARSLVHLARRDIKLGAASKLGTDKTLIDAFTDAFKLNETEIQSYLPFFIGFECLIKVETLDAPVWRQKAAERMYDGFLAEFS